MAPFGDVAPALVPCRAAARGEAIDVIGPLAVEAVARVVRVDVAVGAEVDEAGGKLTWSAVHPEHPGAVDAAVVAGFAAHVAAHPAVGEETDDTGGPSIHAVGGHGVCLLMPAPAGHRAGIGLHRATALTPAERARLELIAPLLACALMAAGRNPPVGRGLLTAREVAVLRIVATGMSDKQVARHLGVSPRTVGKHLEHVYAKLGVAGRTEAARVWAQR